MNDLIHGDNIVLSRQKLNQLIEQSRTKGVAEVIKLDGKKLAETQLKHALETKSFFGAEKLVVIEGLLSRVLSKEKNILVEILGSDSQQTPVILWDAKEITKTWLNKLENFNAQLFKTPASIFKFLDSLKPGNAKISLTLIQHSNKENAPELVFYMLSRRVSDLIIANDPKSTSLLKGAPWQKSRLISQSKNFSSQGLLSFHQDLLSIDESIKTGSALLPLSSQLDLLLAKI